MRTLALGCLLGLLAACGKMPPATAPTIIEVDRPIEVKVPIPIVAQPPPELLQPPKMPIPVFVAPTDPEASSALTVQGERDFRAWVEEMKAWREAVEAFWRAAMAAVVAGAAGATGK